MATETIYSLFRTIEDAERAIGALMDHGVDRDNIGIIARKPAEQDEDVRVRMGYVRTSDPIDSSVVEPVAQYTQRPTTLPPAAMAGTVTPIDVDDTPENVESVGKEGITTTTAADAGAGAAIGTGVGLLTGLLASALVLTVPGVGIVLAAGAVTAAIGATVATTAAGAIAGGVAGYLRDMGMNEAAASDYADRLVQGDYLLAVTVDTSAYDDARRILYKYNAVGVDINVGINVDPAGTAVDSAWASDPSLVQYVDQPLTSRLEPPTIIHHVVTEEPYGTTVEESHGWVDDGMSPKESEAAIDRDMDLDDDEAEYHKQV